MEDEKQEPQSLIDQLKEYAEIRYKIAKFQAIDRGSSIAAGLIADVVVALGTLLAFIFASFTLAFYLAEVLDSFWMGFGCVALIYLFIAIIFKLTKRGIEKPIANTIVRKIFKD
jgi:hypothetical protein